MSKAFKLYRLLNTLSIDVSFGAIVCGLFFARVFAVTIDPAELASLFLTVWIIYTADHLRDAKRIDNCASTERHRFHQRNFKEMVIVLVVMAIVDTILLFFIRKKIFEWGAVLMLFVIIYLVAHSYLRYLKEIIIAIMYTFGIILPSVSVMPQDLTLPHAILISQFALVALINLLMFSWFDRDLDHQDQQHSFVTIAGDRHTRKVIWFLIFLEILLVVGQLLVGDILEPSLLLGIMSLGLLLVFVFRDDLAPNDYYRFIGDAVFIIPVIYLL